MSYTTDLKVKVMDSVYPVGSACDGGDGRADQKTENNVTGEVGLIAEGAVGYVVLKETLPQQCLLA